MMDPLEDGTQIVATSLTRNERPVAGVLTNRHA